MVRLVQTNCARPRPKTSRFMFFSLSKLSSSPISQRKKMMPTSPSVSTKCMSWMREKPEGPMTMPMARKPRTLDMRPMRCASGSPTAVLTSRTRMSRPLPSAAGTLGMNAAHLWMSRAKAARRLGRPVIISLFSFACCGHTFMAYPPQIVESNSTDRRTIAPRTGRGGFLFLSFHQATLRRVKIFNLRPVCSLSASSSSSASRLASS
mmetsp:Transcript_63335/g.137091  ORF Transcript_63335/g.137091 Transcript_63335/m.137091 type:complete len:207 (-) Transcript_63335:11-631(-)